MLADPATWRIRHRLQPPHSDAITALLNIESGEGAFLISASRDASLRLWRVSDNADDVWPCMYHIVVFCLISDPW